MAVLMRSLRRRAEARNHRTEKAVTILARR
jgi:hypothetical protein